MFLLLVAACGLTGQGDVKVLELGPPLVVEEPPGWGKEPAEPLREAYSSATWIDTSNRATVKTAYDTIFVPTAPTSVSWTGSVSGNNPGTTSATYKDAVLTRINWFRAMAGVPANIALDSTYNTKDQKAALIMSSNNQLSHTPPSSWLNWSADGSEAAGKSNLCGGTSYPAEMLSNDPGCVQGYMDDEGTSNTAVGHRRWLLVPQTRYMGTGDVTQTPIGSASPSYMSANAVWVQDGNYSTARPATRDTFVAWPPKGYVPYQVVPRRWSFSYASASFGGATITMSVNGSPVPLTKLTVQPSSGYIGENTVVWEPSTDFTQQPSADTTVNVTISGIGGYPGGSSVSYAVTIFNPAQSSTLQPPVLVTPTNGATGVSTSGLTLAWNASAGATSYDVYAGSANPPPYINNTAATSVSLSGVSSGTTYYWKVVAKSGSTTAASAVWSFTTSGGAPAAPTLVSPTNGATGQSTSSSLQWSSAAGATSYDVHLGTSNPPSYLTNTSATSYSPTLTAGMTYYWK
ncbi:MAG: CAP domain-containing protein, partial [Bryobacterales bacterium]|nr:CAP domain-containing protein [Bryobacterales bacterium]